MTKPRQKARKRTANQIIAGLIADISDRRGLKWEWERIDAEIIDEEIIPAWRDIIMVALNKLLEDAS